MGFGDFGRAVQGSYFGLSRKIWAADEALWVRARVWCRPILFRCDSEPLKVSPAVRFTTIVTETREAGLG